MKKYILALTSALLVSFLPQSFASINTEECRIPILNKDKRYLEGLGKINSVFISVDFARGKSQLSAENNAKQYTENFVRFMRDSSYKKLKINVDVVPRWYRLSKSPQHYVKNIEGLVQESINLSDNDVDFSKYKIVYIVVPDTIKNNPLTGGGAITAGISTPTIFKSKEGSIYNIAFMTNPTIAMGNSRWKLMAHETMHILGIEHPHDYENDHTANMSIFSLMDFGWVAPGLYATEKWKAGWLSNNQIICIDGTKPYNNIITLNSLGGSAKENKAVIVKISNTEILVLESRRAEGLDDLPESYEGLSVYAHDNKYVRPVLKKDYITDFSLPEYNGDRVVNTIQIDEFVLYKNIKITNIKMEDYSDTVKIEIKY